MASELTIDNLPDEVLEFVFTKLTLPDHKTVRLVCKNWLKVSSSVSVTRHEIIKIKLKDLHLYKTPRGCFNIEIYSQELHSIDLKRQEEFWAVHGSSVRYIEVKIFSHLSPVVHFIINYCSNVKELSLEYTRSLSDDMFDIVDNVIVEGALLNCLESLTLKLIPPAFITGAAFSRLAESVPNLKRLKVSFFFDENCPSAGSIKSLIVRQAFTLTELSFVNCWLATELFLESIFEVIGPQLTGLYLEGLKLENIKCLTEHANKLPNLVKLEVSDMQWGIRQGKSLSELVHFTKLEFLSLLHTDLCDEDILPLVALENLKGIDIGSIMSESTAHGIANCFGIKSIPNLTALKMQFLNCVTDQILSIILPNLPNLKFIDLTNCDEITTEGASEIFTNCKQLAYLVLRGCSAIETISHHLSKLKYLDLGRCNIASEGIQLIVAHCPQLTHFSIGTCVTIDDVEPAIFSNLKNLVYFCWSSDSAFDNLGFNFAEPESWFTELFNCCPLLKFARFESVVFERRYGGVARLSYQNRNFSWDPFDITIFNF